MTNSGGKLTFVVNLLHQPDLNSLGKFLDSRAEVAEDDTHLWIRYDSEDELAVNNASRINGRHFRLIEKNFLAPLGSAVAVERLPKLEWHQFAKVLNFKLPTAALAGRLAAAELPELILIRGGVERPAAAGLYLLDEIFNWVVTAPQFRLQKLAACVAEHEVLVIGNPLPPIACEFLCQDGRLLTPAGMTWYPRIKAEEVLEHFDVAMDHLLIWSKTDQWSTLPIDIVGPLRRGSLRAFVDKLKSVNA